MRRSERARRRPESRQRRRRHGHRFVGQIEGHNGRRGGSGLPAVRADVLQPVRLERPGGRQPRSRSRQTGRQVQEGLVPDVATALPKGYVHVFSIFSCFRIGKNEFVGQTEL